MPYSNWSEVNPAIRGIEPRVTLAQANAIADWADAMEGAEDGPDNPWAAAIAQFKRLYEKAGGGWRKKQASNMLQFSINQTGTVRREKVNGVEYLVAPVVAVREGVLNGEYVPAEEIAKSAPSWNGRPFVIGHPNDDDGPVSANAPDMLAQVQAGHFFGVRFEDGALKGDLWVDVARAQLVDGGPETVRRLEAEKPLEVSTAYWRDAEQEPGEFGGKEYSSVARNLRPDHLAGLLETAGACSWEDGCGAPRLNEGKETDECGCISVGMNGLICNDGDELAVHFVSSPRNPYGTHASKGYPGGKAGWIRAWRIHLSKIGGGATTGGAMGPLRGTQRRIAMIAAGMKPKCNIPMEITATRGGAKSPLSGDFKDGPSDYGLSRWKKPSEDNLTSEDVAFTCDDLKTLKRLTMEEINRRIKDREKVEAKEMKDENRVLRALQVLGDALKDFFTGGDEMADHKKAILESGRFELTAEQLDETPCEVLQALTETLGEEDEEEEERPQEPAPESPPEAEPQESDEEGQSADVAALEARIAALEAQVEAGEQEKKNALIAGLAANNACAFTTERLAEMPVGDLEALARSLSPADYSGQGGGPKSDGKFQPYKMPELFAAIQAD